MNLDEPTVEMDSIPDSGVAPLPRKSPGDSFGDYEIMDVLGCGGMGAVYKVRHRTLDRVSALKILHERSVTEDQDASRRFLREARSVARLDHHNIVRVYHAGRVDDELFIEMELVDGEPLLSKLAHGKLPQTDAIRYVEQAAHALQHAHDRGIIHRDIKPSNLLASTDGVVKVLDFGLAHSSHDETMVTLAGKVAGTPCYMPPEQWQGRPTDFRSDLYSLGATFYHLVTGRTPFQGTLADQMRQHVEDPVAGVRHVDGSLSVRIAAIIDRLMAKRPEARYQAISDLIADLRRAHLDVSGPSRPGEDEAHMEPGGTLDEETEWVGSSEPPPALPHPWRSPEGAVSLSSLTRLPRAIKPRPISVGILVFSVMGLVLSAELSGLWNSLELRGLDQRFRLRGATPVCDQVAVIAVDEATVQDLGWPMNRDALVDVIDALHHPSVGAEVTALDILVGEPGPGAGDRNLVAATREAARLIHPMRLTDVAWSASERETGLPGSRFSLSLDMPELDEARHAILPLPGVIDAAHHLGDVGLAVDPDGIIRRVPLLVRFQGKTYPSLSLLAACLAMDVDLLDLRQPGGNALVLHPPGAAPVTIPVDRHARMLISVRGGLDERRVYSFRDVLRLAQRADAEAYAELAEVFGDQVVLVGTLLEAGTDIHPMPGMVTAPLVLAHTMAIETLLARDFLRVPPQGVLLAIVLGCSLVSVFIGRYAAVWLPWIVLPVLVVGYIAAAHLLFNAQGMVVPMVAPCSALLMGGVFGMVHRHWIEHRQRDLLADALGRYVPRRLSQELMADPNTLRLGGHRKELTILSVSIHGFGRISERLEPEEVGEFLHSFFEISANCMTEQEGTIDRYSGEGVRAFFGDPVPLPDHALRAVRCALALHPLLMDYVDAWAAGGRERPVVGIGIHTGYVTVGNIGSIHRMEYTVLGENVHFAEHLSAQAENTVLVSPRTRSLVADNVAVRKVSAASGAATLQGDVYEAIGT